ncbi:MAG: pseudouridine synthase [Candidatus Accumulibacter sp.]|jgi:23S rRNA pseudouridine2605 synthase|nr:pseudouridine synthase [Accumulibacter sp.]
MPSKSHKKTPFRPASPDSRRSSRRGKSPRVAEPEFFVEPSRRPPRRDAASVAKHFHREEALPEPSGRSRERGKPEHSQRSARSEATSPAASGGKAFAGRSRPNTATTEKRFRRGEAPQDQPERLHKLLAQSGLGSRREMEDAISAGRVSINGKTARIGQSAVRGDRVKFDGRLVRLKFSGRLPRVLLYHKPEGEIVSRDDPQRRPSVFAALPRLSGARWVAVGRLDFNTGGLLLFTTSGELADRLMHPRHELIREYAVRILGELTPETRLRLLRGIELDDGPARFSTLDEAGGDGVNHWYRVSLAEGRNREVRRLFEAVGITVSRLMRVRYGPIVLPPRLRRGQVLELGEREVRQLLSEVGGQETVNKSFKNKTSRDAAPVETPRQGNDSPAPRKLKGKMALKAD